VKTGCSVSPGDVRRKKGYLNGALADGNEAVKLDPESADAIVQDKLLHVNPAC
jgi:hypothetical protein